MTTENVGTDVLRTLHRIHRQLNDLKGRLEQGPKRIRGTEAHLAHCEQNLAQLREEAKAARMAADAKQVQLKAGEEKVVDLKRKLNTAKSNREYQALKDQTAAQEMTNSVLTDEILEGLEKLDQLQAKAVEAEGQLANARQKVEAAREEVLQQEPRVREDLSRLEAKLKQCEAALPAEVQELYLRVVRHRGEDALAALEGEYCSGCHQHVPLNVRAEMMLSHIMFCKSCGRLLYMPEDRSVAKP